MAIQTIPTIPPNPELTKTPEELPPTVGSSDYSSSPIVSTSPKGSGEASIPSGDLSEIILGGERKKPGEEPKAAKLHRHRATAPLFDPAYYRMKRKFTSTEGSNPVLVPKQEPALKISKNYDPEGLGMRKDKLEQAASENRVDLPIQGERFTLGEFSHLEGVQQLGLLAVERKYLEFSEENGKPKKMIASKFFENISYSDFGTYQQMKDKIPEELTPVMIFSAITQSSSSETVHVYYLTSEQHETWKLYGLSFGKLIAEEKV